MKINKKYLGMVTGIVFSLSLNAQEVQPKNECYYYYSGERQSICLNCDFFDYYDFCDFLFNNHINHINHSKITVQTKKKCIFVNRK